MGQFDPLKATAKRLLIAKGRPLVLEVYANTTPPDPDKPWRMPEGAPTTYPFKGLIVGFGISRFTQAGELARKCIMPGDVANNATDTPNVTSFIRDAADLWLIEALEPVDPDGSGAIIYLAKINQWPPKT